MNSWHFPRGNAIGKKKSKVFVLLNFNKVIKLIEKAFMLLMTAHWKVNFPSFGNRHSLSRLIFLYLFCCKFQKSHLWLTPLWCCNKLHMAAFSFRLHLLGLFQGFFSFKKVEATYSLFGSSKGAATFTKFVKWLGVLGWLWEAVLGCFSRQLQLLILWKSCIHPKLALSRLLLGLGIVES